MRLCHRAISMTVMTLLFSDVLLSHLLMPDGMVTVNHFRIFLLKYKKAPGDG